MKTRKEIKVVAKERLHNDYWPFVGINFLMLAIISALSASLIGSFIAILFLIGYNKYAVAMYRNGDATLNTAFSNMFTARKFGGYLWMSLFTILWSMLFVIPGIVKSYSYAMTPYILADQPEVEAKEALKLSMRMMKGHKWQLFVFELSFIGWLLLEIITFGLVNIFYSGPYRTCALAGFYEELKKQNAPDAVVVDNA